MTRLETLASRRATCPLTEAGFVRVLSNPRYGTGLGTPADLARRLRRFCRSGGHAFWPDDTSLLSESAFDLSRVGGHRQLIDVYLLGLAYARGGYLATFDRTIPLRAVKGATARSIAVIAPAE